MTSLHLRLDLLAEALRGDPPDLTRAREHAERATAQSRSLIRLADELLQLTGTEAASAARSRPSSSATSRAR